MISAEATGFMKGFEVRRNNVIISHLQFAYDTTFFTLRKHMKTLVLSIKFILLSRNNI